MDLKCKLGLHKWNGCKCSRCDKIRDKQHDWSKNCEKCSVCGKTRNKQHDWDECRCTKCSNHYFVKNGKCKCGCFTDLPTYLISRHPELKAGSDFRAQLLLMPSYIIEEWNVEMVDYNKRIWSNKYTDKSNVNNYKTIEIGKQIWMTENLNVSEFRNGDVILEAKSENDWLIASINKQPMWCYYDYNPINGAKYGKLYNWYAVDDYRGLAPEGYHIPSDTEWNTLSTYLGGESIAGGKLKEAGLANWSGPNTGATNEVGFIALPGGFILNRVEKKNFTGYWWSSSKDFAIPNYAFYRYMVHDREYLGRLSTIMDMGYSVRCLRNRV